MTNPSLAQLIHCDLDTGGIDYAYNTVVTKVNEYAPSYFQPKRFAQYLKPYWNDELTVAHREQLNFRSILCGEGRPRSISSDSYYN